MAVITRNGNTNGHAPLKLDVLVVGAGVAGLSAAIACAEKGWNVTALEATTKFATVGAGLMISANASRLMVDWGLKEAMDSVGTASKRTKFINWDGKKVISDTPFDAAAIEKELGAPNWQIHRADLHDVLLRKARAVGVNILMGAKVNSYDWDAPSVTLEDGVVHKADVILAADGYRSRTRAAIPGLPEEPNESGTSAFRIVIHKDHFQDDPELKDLLSTESQISMCWIGNGNHILGYPIRNGEFYNIASTQPEVQTSLATKTYVVPTSAKTFRESYAGWDPLLEKILKKVPEQGTLEWKLADLERLDTYLAPGGKVALLGDAAHPMLPSAAQGAGMGMEDGAAAAEFLARAEDKSQIPKVMKAWERMRMPRCSFIVSTGRNHAQQWHEKDPEVAESKDYFSGWNYNVVEEARKFPLEA